MTWSIPSGGRAGTDVSIRVRRPGMEVPIPFTITRAVIELRSVPFALEVGDGIGYVLSSPSTKARSRKSGRLWNPFGRKGSRS